MSNLQASNLFSVQDRVVVITGGGSGEYQIHRAAQYTHANRYRSHQASAAPWPALSL